jgi:hypothetical protein
MSKGAYDVFALIINLLENDQGSPNMWPLAYLRGQQL